jgi:methylenetetrahydrofolate reductase (NADPH)
LRAADASESVLAVAGNPAEPEGPYPDAATVIGSGFLEEHWVRQASIAGHPGGRGGALWAALAVIAHLPTTLRRSS